MTITPTGAPAWTRTVSHVDYGGHPSKRDYMGQGAIDALTDLSAAQLCRLASDVAAVVRTAEFAVMVLLCNDSSPAAPTVEFVSLMTGVRLVEYAGDAAPSGFPSAARNGNGDVTITFASSYTDDYGVVGDYAPIQAHPTVQSSSAHYATAVVSGQTVRVRAVDAAGSAVSDARISLTVT